MNEIRHKFEAWVTAMEPAYAAENLERLTGGRGSYKIHNVACWWMAWRAAYEAGEIAMKEKAAEYCKAYAELLKPEDRAALRLVGARIRALPLSGAEESKK